MFKIIKFIKSHVIAIILICIILIGIAATLFLILGNNCFFIISNSELISNIIQIWIGVGAFISATIIIGSYIITNRAFILSQKPYLYLIARNHNKIKRDKNSNEFIHATQIHYENISNNPFYDLTINVRVSTLNTEVDLSDLFTKKMYMSAHDVRDRNFVTVDELNKRGFNLDSAINENKDILLSLNYTFTFNNKEEIIDVQKYKWDKSRMEWSIM